MSVWNQFCFINVSFPEEMLARLSYNMCGVKCYKYLKVQKDD